MLFSEFHELKSFIDPQRLLNSVIEELKNNFKATYAGSLIFPLVNKWRVKHMTDIKESKEIAQKIMNASQMQFNQLSPLLYDSDKFREFMLYFNYLVKLVSNFILTFILCLFHSKIY